MEKGFRGRSSMALFLVHERGSNMLVCINKRSRWVPLVIRGLDRCRGWSPVTAREMEGVDFSRFIWSALVESRWKDRCKKWKTAKKEEIMMEEVNREAGKEQRVGKQENKEKYVRKEIKQKGPTTKSTNPVVTDPAMLFVPIRSKCGSISQQVSASYPQLLFTCHVNLASSFP